MIEGKRVLLGNCKDCAFYGRRDDTCRVSPPTIPDPQAHHRGQWPTVLADDWCGKFMPYHLHQWFESENG